MSLSYIQKMKQIEQYSLLNHNTFGIDARCNRFCEYTSVEELQQFISTLHQEPQRHLLHIGGGSNLLFTKDFEGTILHSAIKGIETTDNADGTVTVRAGAGEGWDEFVAHCVANGLYGLENLSLIPGEVGASAVQNIGAYGTEVADCIELVEAVSLSDGTVHTFINKECRYAYRSSIFKTALRGQYAITHVSYRLSRTFKADISYGGLAREIAARGLSAEGLTAQTLRELIIDIRRNKLPDPKDIGSAGSFFINPVVSTEKFAELAARYPNIPPYPPPDGVKVPAGWLIDQCGWKGKKLGRAGVYEKQALVLINCGGATGSDIVALSDAIRADVRHTFGIEIVPEVNFI